MHDSSLRKIEAFCRDYLGAHRASALEIVDLGARNVDGMRTYRRFFDAPAWRYRGLDIEPGPNVDLVVADPYRWDGLPESSIDVLISGQTLEHVEFPWLTMEQIARVLRGGSFFSNDKAGHCAFRNWDEPGNRNLSVGFRVVVSPSFSPR